MTHDECLKKLLDLCDTKRWPSDERALAQLDRDIDAFLAQHGSTGSRDPLDQLTTEFRDQAPGANQRTSLMLDHLERLLLRRQG